MWYDQIKKQFDENPAQTVMVAALATTALAKLIDAVSVSKGRRAYARQIDYKIRQRRR